MAGKSFKTWEKKLGTSPFVFIPLQYPLVIGSSSSSWWNPLTPLLWMPLMPLTPFMFKGVDCLLATKALEGSELRYLTEKRWSAKERASKCEKQQQKCFHYYWLYEFRTVVSSIVGCPTRIPCMITITSFFSPSRYEFSLDKAWQISRKLKNHK